MQSTCLSQLAAIFGLKPFSNSSALANVNNNTVLAVLEGIDFAILLAYASGIDGKETPPLR